MVGREVEAARRERGGARSGEAVLEVEGVSAERRPRRDGRARRHDRACAPARSSPSPAWPGNGQRELAEAIAGLRPLEAGAVAGRRPAAARRATRATPSPHGLAYVPEDRLATGVSPSLSIADNVVLKSYRRPPASMRPAAAPAARSASWPSR